MNLSSEVLGVGDSALEQEDGIVLIRSVANFIELCSLMVARTGKKFWYRGQQERYPLSPSLYRHQTLVKDACSRDVSPDAHLRSSGCEYEYLNFRYMLDAFKQRGIRYFQRHPQDDFEWMFLMQHHGIPTRLLDWTTDPLVALYFATFSEDQFDMSEDDRAVVWLLDPVAINKNIHEIPSIVHLSETTWSAYLEGTEPAPVCAYASHIDDRIIAQSGVFTLHGNDLRPLDAVYSVRKEMAEVRIPGPCIPQIKQELSAIGYNPSRLFPSIDSVAKEIREDELRRYELWREGRRQQFKKPSRD